MEIFWIVVCVVVVVIYVINHNKTKTTDKTVIRQKDTYKTETGEVTIERTKTVDTSQTTFTSPQPVQLSSTEVHNQALAHGRSQQAVVVDINPTTITASPMKEKLTTLAENRVIEPNTWAEDKKQCTRCRVNLPLSKFSKSSKNPDGVTIWCTECLKGDKNTKHMKWCPKCKIRRKRTSFYTNNNNADSLMAWCKSCWDAHKKH
jgi:hypothetical protein